MELQRVSGQCIHVDPERPKVTQYFKVASHVRTCCLFIHKEEADWLRESAPPMNKLGVLGLLKVGETFFTAEMLQTAHGLVCVTSLQGSFE